MDENEVTNKEHETTVNEEVTVNDLNQNLETAEEVFEKEKRPNDVVFKHPHQTLSNKQIQLLFRKQAWLEKEKQAKKERGEEEEVEELTPIEKSAIDLFILRAKHQHSKPKPLSSKQRTAKKLKRRISKQSRKANR